MAYVIFSANGEEIDRRELKDSASFVVGRAPDCSICVRDIMLSRRHCSLEMVNEQWIVTDLGSRNGTFLAEERIERHILRDCDSLRMGRTWMIFRAGPFVPGPNWDADKQRTRPVDPNEAMAGTVVGFELLEPGEADYDEAMPVPQPRPRDSRSYEREGVRMVNDISSNAWDAQHQQVATQLRVHQSTARTASGKRVAVKPKSRVAFYLQADEEATGEESSVGRQLSAAERRVVVACLSMAVTLIGCAIWIAWQSRIPAAAAMTPVQAPSTQAVKRVEAAPAQTASETAEPFIPDDEVEEVESIRNPEPQQLPETGVILEAVVRALIP
jgi:predicted component of type VI protein secretion system